MLHSKELQATYIHTYKVFSKSIYAKVGLFQEQGVMRVFEQRFHSMYSGWVQHSSQVSCVFSNRNPTVPPESSIVHINEQFMILQAYNMIYITSRLSTYSVQHYS